MKKLLIVLVIVAAALIFASPALAFTDGWSYSDDFDYRTADGGWATCYVQVDREHIWSGYPYWEFQRIRLMTDNTGHNKTFTVAAYSNWDLWYEPTLQMDYLSVSVPAGTWATLTHAQTNPWQKFGPDGYDESGLEIGFVGVRWTDGDGYHALTGIRWTVGDNWYG